MSLTPSLYLLCLSCQTVKSLYGLTCLFRTGWQLNTKSSSHQKVLWRGENTCWHVHYLSSLSLGASCNNPITHLKHCCFNKARSVCLLLSLGRSSASVSRVVSCRRLVKSLPWFVTSALHQTLVWKLENARWGQLRMKITSQIVCIMTKPHYSSALLPGRHYLSSPTENCFHLRFIRVK